MTTKNKPGYVILSFKRDLPRQKLAEEEKLLYCVVSFHHIFIFWIKFQIKLNWCAAKNLCVAQNLSNICILIRRQNPMHASTAQENLHQRGTVKSMNIGIWSREVSKDSRNSILNFIQITTFKGENKAWKVEIKKVKEFEEQRWK